MKLDVSRVKHVARLANLSLNTQEEEKYARQLSKIIEYVEQLNQVDTSEVEATFTPVEQNTVMRKDETQAGLSQEDALSNAAKKKNRFFMSKGVFNG